MAEKESKITIQDILNVINSMPLHSRYDHFIPFFEWIKFPADPSGYRGPSERLPTGKD